MGRGAERNQPCGCGSGLKYKKCCGTTGQPGRLGPDFETKFEALLLSHESSVRSRVEAALRRVNEGTRTTTQYNRCHDDSERVNCLIKATDQAAADVLNTSIHSRQYWYQLLRRLAPIAIRKFAHAPSESDDPGFIWRATIRAGSFPIRYLRAVPPQEWVEQSNVRGITYGFDDETICVLTTLSFLGAYRVLLENAYRIAAKGVPLKLGPEPWKLGAAPTTAISNYESRRDRFETLLGRAGFWYDSGALHPAHPEFCGVWQVVTAGERRLFHIISQYPSTDITGHFLPVPYIDFTRLRMAVNPHAPLDNESIGAKMLPYDILLARSPQTVQSTFDIKADTLTLFLYALYRLVYTQIPWSILEEVPERSLTFLAKWPNELPEKARSALLGRLHDACAAGFFRGAPDDWVQHLTSHAHQIAETIGMAPFNADQCRRIMRRFTLEGDSEVEDRPFLWVLLSEKTIVLDLLRTPEFFYELFLALGANAEKIPHASREERRASLHEEHAGAFFARELRIESAKMLVSRKLKVGNEKVEVDVAFVVERTLFVIDCKAASKDGRYYEGVSNKWRNRLDTYKEELETKCCSRIRVIRNGAASPIIGQNDFDEAFSLVCTATVEFLPDDEPTFWHKGFARVGPPEELLELIRIVAVRR